MEELFSDGFFPRALVEGKGRIFEQAVWSQLLRPEQGDPSPEDFFPDGNFKFIAVSEVPDAAGLLPSELAANFTEVPWLPARRSLSLWGISGGLRFSLRSGPVPCALPRARWDAHSSWPFLGCL